MMGGERQSIVVIGTGYVGLPAALMLARAGHQVMGVDIDENVVRAINDGVLHIDELRLQELMDEPKVRSNLHAARQPVEADVFIIAVPTPLDQAKKVADLTQIEAAVRSVIPVLREGNLVIIESTVPPLTCRNVVNPILEESGMKAGIDFHLAHCPERILPGDVFREIVENDRIIGSETELGRERARSLYASFVEGALHLTDDVTAELVKLMENTYRDVNIALANELHAVASGLGVDGRAAISLASMHPRVNILSPGIGVGGHCIPIDPWFIKEVDPQNTRLIDTARRINDARPEAVASEIRRAVADVESPRVVLVGAAYKPDTADLRESPALAIAGLLLRDGYDVVTYDPLFDDYRVGGSVQEVAVGADILVILVPHSDVVAEINQHRAGIEAAMKSPRFLWP